MRARFFFLGVLSSLFVALCLLGFFNWLINPFALFASPAIEGLNRYKTQFFGQLYVSKPYVVNRVRPDGIILGTSRAGAALSARHPAWADYRAYNFALPGSTAFVQLLSLQHVLASGSPRRVLLPIDFLMFNSCNDPVRSAHIAGYAVRVGGSGWSKALQALDDYLNALISLNALQLSLTTIQSQQGFANGGRGQMHLREDGFWPSPIPQGQRQRKLFQRVERHYMRSMWSSATAHCSPLAPKEQAYQTGYFRELLTIAYRRNLTVYLYFSPVHARLLEAMRHAGVWPMFEQLKRELVRLNVQLAGHYGRVAFPLWDFSGYNAVTTEPVPTIDDRTSRMRYFLDPTHATALTGELIQNTIFGFSDPSTPEGFGTLLGPDNIEAAIALDLARRETWASQHHRDIAEIVLQAR